MHNDEIKQIVKENKDDQGLWDFLLIFPALLRYNQYATLCKFMYILIFKILLY